MSRRAGRARKRARRTLEERRNSDDDLDGIAEGRVEQPGECLAQLERELICRGAEQLDEHCKRSIPFKPHGRHGYDVLRPGA